MFRSSVLHCPEVLASGRHSFFDLRARWIGRGGHFFPVCPLVRRAVHLNAPMTMIEHGPPSAAARVFVGDCYGNAVEVVLRQFPASARTIGHEQPLAGGNK